jgi:NCS1 family nucleobase:cation symporter-1
VEVNGINTIAPAERSGRPRDLFMPWFAGNISVLGLSYGAWVLAFGASALQTVAAVVAGVMGSFLLVGFASLAGQRGSAPTMVLSRAAFGVRGNAVPTFLAYLSLVGWEVVLVSLAVLMSRTVAQRLGADGTQAMIVAFVLVVGVVLTSGIHGFRLVMRVQRLITWVTAALTVGYLALVAPQMRLDGLAALPQGSAAAGLGAFVFCLTGFGLSWVNCAAGYSRYLPRDVSGRAVVGWTTLGAAAPPLVLTLSGLLLAASDPTLAHGIAHDPIGALTTTLPTWYVLPFAVVALLGLVAGAILDIYSSGLTLLTLGLPVPRWAAVALDGVLMVIGTAYVVWVAEDFLGAFQAFLLTLGAPLAAWTGVFLGDLALRRTPYDETALHRADGRYGATNRLALAWWALGTLIGWGLVVNSAMAWQGYLLGPLGGRDGALAGSGLGILVALAIGFLGTVATGRERVRRQEAAPPRTAEPAARQGHPAYPGSHQMSSTEELPWTSPTP